MSFIYENLKLLNLLQEIGDKGLIKSAQEKDPNEWKKNFSKDQVQEAEGSSADKTKIINLAKKLLSELEPEIGQSDEKPSPFTVGGSSPQVSPQTQDLRSLDSLLRFLNKNVVKYNGNSISELIDTDLIADKKVVDKKSNKIDEIVKSSQATQSFDAEYGVAGFRIKLNKEGLKQYILKLREDAATSKNALFILYVGKLIKQANDEFGFGIKELDQKTAEQEGSDKAKSDAQPDQDNIVLDYLPRVYDSLKKPLEASRDKQLLAKNLKTDQDFVNWLTGTPNNDNPGPKMLLVSEDGKRQFDVGSTGPEYPQPSEQICSILSGMLKRAQSSNTQSLLATQSNSPKQTYIKLISELASKYQCKLNVPEGLLPKPSGTTSQVSTIEAAKDKFKKDVLSFMPIDDEYIDLKKMEQFFNKTIKYMGDITGSELADLKELSSTRDAVINNSNLGLKYVTDLLNQNTSTTKFEWFSSSISKNIENLSNIYGNGAPSPAYALAIDRLNKALNALKTQFINLLGTTLASDPDIKKMFDSGKNRLNQIQSNISAMFANYSNNMKKV